MGQYRARDLLLLPNILSAARLPLGVAFVYALERPWLALCVLVISGLSDVFDGWYARKYGQATPTGAVVDGVCDKTFTAIVVLSLIARGAFTWSDAILLATRDLLELPLVLWWALHRRKRQARARAPMANRLGKLATVFQFATICAALFHHPLKRPILFATALMGLVAAVSYWRRELGAGSGARG